MKYVDPAVVISLIIFIVTYALIISEKVHRTTAAMTGATLMVIVGLNYGILSRDVTSITQHDIVAYVDFNTIGLLLGMMIIIAVLHDTGFFEYLGNRFLRVSKGDLWKMLVIFATVTAVMSMFLDNTTTILLMVPLTISITEKMEINPIPLVITESIFSNIGGIATLIGDPPNVMIGSASGLTFNQFITHLMPLAIIVMVATLILVRFMFKKYLRKNDQENEALINNNGKEENLIKDPSVLRKALAVLLITITLFALHDEIGLMPSVVALIGASIVLLITRSDPGKVFEKVEWTSFMFFVGLFIMVGTLAHTGILEDFANLIMGISGDSPLKAAILILWTSAVISAVLDNIPFTVTMIPVIAIMGTATGAHHTLWWMLAIGVGFGGFATPIGSTPGIITSGICNAYGHKVSFLDWMKIGVPIMLLGLGITTLIIVAFPALLY